MAFKTFLRTAFAIAALGAALATAPARAEVSEVRISKGFGILYLPLIVMQDQQFLEKRAKAAGLGDIKVTWLMLDGGNVINDAMMAGTLDFAGTGAPGFVTLWAKAKGIPGVEVVGVSGMSSTALWMMSNKPELKSLKDFTSGDKIALPGIKTSLAAVVLQMIAAKEFGDANYAKMDPMTVSLPHPEALAALVAQVIYLLTEAPAGALFRKFILGVRRVEEEPFAVPNLGLRWQRTIIRLTCGLPQDRFDPAGGLPEPVRSLMGVLPEGSYARGKLDALAGHFAGSTLPSLAGVAIFGDPDADPETDRPIATTGDIDA